MADQPTRLRRRLISPFFVLAFVAAFLVVSALWPNRPPADDGKLRIVCTFLPVYVFTENVVGDAPGVDVQLMIDRDVGCPHSYSLTGQDLKMVSRADIVVANGLGAEPFLDQMLRGRDDLKVLTISDDCSVIRYEPSPGTGQDHASEHAGGNNSAGEQSEHARRTNHDHEHAEGEVNPHTWVSPRQAATQVRTLARKLAEADPQRAEQYRANGQAYAARLEALAQRMEQAARGFTRHNVVTGHAAFDYLARDLGLNIVATLRVIPGETGSAVEMAHVIDAIRDTHAAAVFWEPPFGDRLAETVARETGVPVFPLNPFNTDSGLPEVRTPEQTRRMYEDVMMQNLATLQQALGASPAASGPGAAPP